jgi:periplasmic protein TonB
MAGSAEIFFEHDRWGRALAWSAGFHLAVAASLLLYTALLNEQRGQGWGTGGGGDAIGATLVSSVPLPASPVQNQNVLANESKGLTKSQPKAEEKEPDAVPIAARNAKIKPKTTETVAKKPQPEQPPTNQAAFGEGGPVSGPYGTFTATNAKGGFGINGNGDFGTKYAWYVQAMSRKISENWQRYEVDSSIHSAPRVYITFNIAKDGSPHDVQIEQSSGVPSLDISAVRALQRIDTFGALPPDYSGSKIAVEYWFDYSRK